MKKKLICAWLAITVLAGVSACGRKKLQPDGGRQEEQSGSSVQEEQGGEGVQAQPAPMEQDAEGMADAPADRFGVRAVCGVKSADQCGKNTVHVFLLCCL